jgi:hypothetical protein
MSKPSAIAAVTQTLASLLEAALQVEDASYTVSTLPPDKSNAEAQNPNRLNLFLFQVVPNAAWRNTNLPDRTRPGEAGQPPLALTLSYMLTVYGEPGTDRKEHRILGLAMQFMHDHPFLMRQDIIQFFTGSDLEGQIDRVRIVPRTLSLEELVRMWGTFMTQYRLSVAYDVSVVLIDSTAGGAAGPPILKRGDQDSGVFSEAGLPPFLTQVLPPEMLRRGSQITYQPAVRLGETLTIEGERLPSENLILQIRSSFWEPRWAGITNLTPANRANALQAVLADPPTEIDPPGGAAPPLVWAPGVYTATLLLRRPDLPDVVSNAVPFALAPQVTVNPNNAAPGDLDIMVSCLPPPRPEQHAFMLLTGHDPGAPVSLTPAPGPGQPATFTFHVAGLSAGEYLVRLRIDGVDSLPYNVVTKPGQPPSLEYDPAQKVVIQ